MILRTVLASVLIVTALPVFAAEKPHIVIYLSDDHSWFDCGLAGAKDIPTPQFEKLASNGMVFSHCFVASPSCAPSRSAMLTGLMPARNGAEANHTLPRPGAHYLIRDLQKCGYEVAAFGKVAHGRVMPKKAGFDVIEAGAAYARLQKTVPRYLKNRKSKKPLCLFVGISNPHVPWPEKTSFDPQKVLFPPSHLDTPSTRAHRASYYQEIKEVDQLLGQLRGWTARHLGRNVLFIHSSDHGSQWPFGKWTLYDYGIRVPFLASWPGVIKPGSKTDAMISWIDLLPTILECAGGKAPSGIDGKSFADVLHGKTASHRQEIFTTQTGDGKMNIYPIRSIRTKEWKLIHNLHPEFAFTNHSDLLRKPGAGAFWTEWARLAKTNEKAKKVVDRYYRRPKWELYHVSQDKWELKNLAEDPRQKERLSGLKKRLAQWMAKQGDKGRVHHAPRPLSKPETWYPDYFKPLGGK